MSDEVKRIQALHILELDEHATWSQVDAAYQHLMARYHANSLASYGLLRPPERHKLLEAIGKAYGRLYQMRSLFPPERHPDSPGDTPGESSPVLPERTVEADLPKTFGLSSHEKNIPKDAEVQREPHPSKSTDKSTDQSTETTSVAAGHKAATMRGVVREQGNTVSFDKDVGSQTSQPQLRSLEGEQRSVRSGAFFPGHVSSNPRLLAVSQPENAVQQESVLVLSSSQEHANGVSTYGDVLRQARDSHRISVEELAQQLACFPHELQALERDDYQHVVSSKGLKKLVERYADLVGLDRQQLVIQILSAYWNWRADRRKSH